MKIDTKNKKFEQIKVVSVYHRGQLESKTYDEVCLDLGYNPNAHFISVTPAHTISFTCGKPEEINMLFSCCILEGYKISAPLAKAAFDIDGRKEIWVSGNDCRFFDDYKSFLEAQKAGFEKKPSLLDKLHEKQAEVNVESREAAPQKMKNEPML